MPMMAPIMDDATAFRNFLQNKLPPGMGKPNFAVKNFESALISASNCRRPLMILLYNSDQTNPPLGSFFENTICNQDIIKTLVINEPI